MAIYQCGALFKHLHTGIAQQIEIDAVEPSDFSVLVCHQNGPIKMWPLGQTPAITSGILKIMGIIRRITEELLGDAPDIDTGTAKIALFRQCRSGAKTRGNSCGAHAS